MSKQAESMESRMHPQPPREGRAAAGADSPFAPPTGPVHRMLVTLGLIATVVAAALAGAYWHEPICDRLGLHEHEAGTVAAAEADAEETQLWTCGMHPQVIQDGPGQCPICGMDLEPMKTGAAASAGITAIVIDPAVVQNMGVRVAEVSTGPVRRAIRAVGVLEQAQPRVHDVNLRVSGWVEKLYAHTDGMFIEEGQPLFELYSPEVQVAVEELIAGRRAMASMPMNAGATARETSEMLVRAARRRLEQWGLSPAQLEELAQLDQAPRTVTFLSPMTGEVTEKAVVEGAMVEAGTRALRLVDRSVLWLDAQVHAQDLPFVRVGLRATATIESMPGARFAAEVIFIHPEVDPSTRTARVRMALPNPELILRPGMYATATISATLEDDALLVPREAVLDTGERAVVFVSKGDGHFEPREVETGAASDDGTVQILAGLERGETVVTSGQFLMDAESRMKEALQKHLHDRLLTADSLIADAGEHGEVGHNANEHNAGEEYGQADVTPRIEGSPEWHRAVDDAVVEYLELSDVLGAVQADDTPLDATPFVESAMALRAASDDEAQRVLAERIVEAAEAMRGRPRDEQREAFKAVSDAMVALVEASPPSTKVADELYVLYCPMAEGQWLQDAPEKANPYYATSMKQCADVVRSVETARR